MPAPKIIRIGNLKGAVAWCQRCQKYTDHTSYWHDKYGPVEKSGRESGVGGFKPPDQPTT